MSTPGQPPGVRRSERAKKVSVAQTEVAAWLEAFQSERELTDIEMLQAVHSWEALVFKYMLREERHPDDPDRPADQA